MLTLRQCRELLPNGVAMSDAEVEHRREQLRAFAEVVVDMLRRDRRDRAARTVSDLRPDAGQRVDDADGVGLPAALRHMPERERHGVRRRNRS